MRLTVERRMGGELWSGPAGSDVMGVVVGDALVLDGARLHVIGRVVVVDPAEGDPARVALTLVVDELS